jgi:arylsulfatase A-like enzyme
MWVGFSDPHRSYGDAPRVHDPDSVFVPAQLIDDAPTRLDIAAYYDEIHRMDTQIGLMLDQLDARGLAENTLVVFLSDNGMPFPRAKGTAYDEGIRTPLIFRWPGVIEPGAVYEGLVSAIDLAPTWLDAAGVAKPDHMEGESLVPIFQDPDLPGREVIFAERNWHDCDEHIRALRTRRYKLIKNAYTHLPLCTAADLGGSPSFRSLRKGLRAGTLTPGQARLFEAPRAVIELYDLERDPHEFVNLADRDEYWQLARELAQQLDRWMEETGDFPPHERVRADHTDRVTGVMYSRQIPPMRNAEGEQEP